MNVLVTGNLGYVGSAISESLSNILGISLTGIDTGFFEKDRTFSSVYTESLYHQQVRMDIRNIKAEDLNGFDVVVHLAAISNDPMGNKFEQVTQDINSFASASLAKLAKAAGVKKFIFASSCSLYGASDGVAKIESDDLQPLTAYARSKQFMEQFLLELSSDSFQVTCLRFATACGMSPRLRLDLVLNDFVASALVKQHIEILSDGSPWRPFIDVKDMGRAITWAILREASYLENFLSVNVGSNQNNFQVAELANIVADAVGNTTISINKNAAPDKRSYKVDFSLFESLAADFLPIVTITESINRLVKGLEQISFNNADFRTSNLIRLNRLTQLQASGQLDSQLLWRN